MAEDLRGLFYDLPTKEDDFAYEHLPVPLAAVALAFKETADFLCEVLPEGADRQVALRKLLLSRNFALRAVEA